jgi:hypothetical protein
LHLRRVGRLALIAMVGLALAPTLSLALASVDGDALARADVCTLRGAGGDGSGPSLLGHLVAQCPYCGLGADAPGLPGTLRVAAACDGAGAMPLPAAPQAPASVAAWTDALPRAPPRLP